MLDPQARALIDLMVARQVPPTHTLDHLEARRFYLERRAITQPDPPAVGAPTHIEVVGIDERPELDFDAFDPAQPSLQLQLL